MRMRTRAGRGSTGSLEYGRRAGGARQIPREIAHAEPFAAVRVFDLLPHSHGNGHDARDLQRPAMRHVRGAQGAVARRLDQRRYEEVLELVGTEPSVAALVWCVAQAAVQREHEYERMH